MSPKAQGEGGAWGVGVEEGGMQKGVEYGCGARRWCPASGVKRVGQGEEGAPATGRKKKRLFRNPILKFLPQTWIERATRDPFDHRPFDQGEGREEKEDKRKRE